MARLVPAGLIAAFSIFPSMAFAADPSESPWRVRDKPPAVRSFEISNEQAPTRWERSGKRRIIAGRRIAPGGTIGFGIFGQKPMSTTLAPVTGRDLALPKQRRAGVGFSLRF